MITRESIQELLEVHPPSKPIIVQYDDCLESIKEMVRILGSTLNKKSMNTIPFNPEMRMLVNLVLYLIQNTLCKF